MKKIVINNCFGGFSLSHEGVMRYLELAGIEVWPDFSGEYVKMLGPVYWTVPPDKRAEHGYDQQFHCRDLDRSDPLLCRVVEEMGRSANGPYASLVVVEIPDDVEWTIEEYDGSEHVAEAHRTWE